MIERQHKSLEIQKQQILQNSAPRKKIDFPPIEENKKVYQGKYNVNTPSKQKPQKKHNQIDHDKDSEKSKSDYQPVSGHNEFREKSFDKISYSLCDLSSLEEANIDQNLLDNQLLQRDMLQEETLNDMIDRFSKIFGCARQNTLFQIHKQLRKLKEDQQPGTSTYEICESQIQTIQCQIDLMERQTEEIMTNKLTQHRLDPSDNNDHDWYDKLYKHKMDTIFMKNKLSRKQSIHENAKIDKKNEIIKLKVNNRKTKVLKYTIRQDTVYFKIWTVISQVNCLVSTVAYPYYMIKGIEPYTQNFWLMIIFESIFSIEILINFVKQDLDDQGVTKIEPLSKIAFRYLQSQFVVDIIALIPWGYIFNQFDILWGVKAIRIKSLIHQMSNKMILPPIIEYINYRQKLCLNDENLKYQMNEDCVFITEKIMSMNIIKTIRLCLSIMIFAYFIGSYWYIFSIMAQSLMDRLRPLDHVDSFANYEHGLNLSQQTPEQQVLISMYFAFTSLSTVGFGDYYPVSDLERLVGSFVLLAGVAMFSYILSDLLSQIELIKKQEALPGNEEDLDRFFATLQGFNYMQPIDQKLQQKIRTFIILKWENDKNNFLLDDQDKSLYDQLPANVKTTIYTEFMFKSFLFKFRKFLDFHKYLEKRPEESMQATQQTKLKNKIKRNSSKILGFRSIFSKIRGSIENSSETVQYIIQRQIERKKQEQLHFQLQKDRINMNQLRYPFYRCHIDDNYQEFLTRFIQNLEIRYFEARQTIVQELDDSLEIIFVETGRYDYGYEINKKKYFRRQFGCSTIIGGFNMCFKERHQYNIRANSDVTGLAIVRKNWYMLMNDFPVFDQQIQQKVLTFYFRQILRPLSILKDKDIEMFERRQDYHSILTLKQDHTHFIEKYFLGIKDKKEIEKARRIQRETSKITWLLRQVQKKLQKYFVLSSKVMSKCENARFFLHQQLIDIIEKDNFKKPDKVYNLIRDIQDTLFTFQEQIEKNVLAKHSYDYAKFQYKTKMLHESLYPETLFQEILYQNKKKRLMDKRASLLKQHGFDCFNEIGSVILRQKNSEAFKVFKKSLQATKAIMNIEKLQRNQSRSAKKKNHTDDKEQPEEVQRRFFNLIDQSDDDSTHNKNLRDHFALKKTNTQLAETFPLDEEKSIIIDDDQQDIQQISFPSSKSISRYSNEKQELSTIKECTMSNKMSSLIVSDKVSPNVKMNKNEPMVFENEKRNEMSNREKEKNMMLQLQLKFEKQVKMQIIQKDMDEQLQLQKTPQQMSSHQENLTQQRFDSGQVPVNEYTPSMAGLTQQRSQYQSSRNEIPQQMSLKQESSKQMSYYNNSESSKQESPKQESPKSIDQKAIQEHNTSSQNEGVFKIEKTKQINSKDEVTHHITIQDIESSKQVSSNQENSRNMSPKFDTENLMNISKEQVQNEISGSPKQVSQRQFYPKLEQDRESNNDGHHVRNKMEGKFEGEQIQEEVKMTNARAKNAQFQSPAKVNFTKNFPNTRKKPDLNKKVAKTNSFAEQMIDFQL